MKTTRTRKARGFTLLEVLIAVTLTATIMLAVGSAFRAMLETREVIDELSESTAAGPRIISLIERDLRGLWTYNIGNNAVLKGTNADVGSFEADRIDMLTSTDAVGVVVDQSNQPRKPSVNEVGYWLKQNPRYRDLIELWRREDPMVDDKLNEQGSFQLIHDRIKTFKLTYFRTLGAEAEELNEWDSSLDDELPRRIKLEFTIERQRGSRNVVNNAEIEDFEGAEKTYVRHFVLDRRLQTVLKAGTAMIPLLPPPPEDPQQGPAGPAGPGGPVAGGPAGPGGMGRAGAMGPGGEVRIDGAGAQQRGGGRGDNKGGAPTATGFPGGTRGGPGSGGAQGTGNPPPGFNLGDLLRGGGGGGQGLGGLFGGGAGGGGAGGGRR